MPKVSIIIPVYNVEACIRECLDSVKKQTLADIEIVCINDGSPDNSLAILNEYASNDNRFVIIDKQNEGVGRARNDGINKATGEFVCFMDPDDFYPSNDVLETLYNKAIENNVNIAGGEFSEFDGENITQNYEGSLYEDYLFKSDGIVEYKDYQFDYGYHRFLYKRSFLIDNNIYFPSYVRFQDPPFFCEAMATAGKFYAIHKNCYAYRVGHKTISWTKDRIYGVFKGLNDNLRIANKYKYEKLKRICEHRLCSEYEGLFYKNFNLNNTIIYFSNLLLISPEKLIKFFIQNIFSIRNSFDKRHKIITLFGLRLKFRR